MLRSISSRFAAPMVSRSFSTEATKTRRVPNISGPNAKFIRSMFDYCKNESSLKETSAGIHKFMAYMEATRDQGAIDAFLNPIFQDAQRDVLIAHYLEQLQCNSAPVAHWFYTIAQQKLYSKMKALVADFDKLVTYEFKEVYATVTSAEPLDQATLDRLTAVMKKQIAADETLVLEQKVDPSIVGGLIIALDENILDHSVATSLNQLNAEAL